MALHRTPIDGIPITAPLRPPKEGEILLGYELINENPEMFVRPNPHEMGTVGWISVIGLLLICWPISCVPCCLGCSYPVQQRPVYGEF